MIKLAFLILAHADPEHFGKLVRALDYKCDIFVHIDKKSDISPFKSVVRTNNVQFLDNLIPVAWCGISAIDAEMELIKIALKNKENYTHLVFLSGADYPIKNIREIHRKLTEDPKREFIKFIDMRQSPEHYMKQISQIWFKEPFFRTKNKPLGFVDKALRKTLSLIRIKHKWDNRIVPYCGSAYWALTTDCCQYLLDYHIENPWFRKMNRYTWGPDEHYIHTIVGNSTFLDSSDGVRPFQGRATWRLANLHIIDKSLSKCTRSKIGKK